MKSIFLIASLILFTLFISCNSETTEYSGYGDGGGAGAGLVLESPPPINGSFKFAPPDYNEDDTDFKYDNIDRSTPGERPKINKKKLIKDGEISINTKDIFAGKKRIDSLLKKLDAYYDREDLQNDEKQISYELVIRVPVEHFEKLISGIESGNDEIISKSIQARDVTGEYIDNEVRLNNKREYLKRYKELLPKAQTVKDILALEENIRNLQEEIESREGRLNFLDDQVAYSSLIINLLKEKEFVYKPQHQDKFPERVKKSLNQGWKSVVDFVLWSISLWPFIFLIVAFIFMIRWFRKRRKMKALAG